MTRDDYHRIRDGIYKNAGMDKFDFDLMMYHVASRAVLEEREACAKTCENIYTGEEASGDWPTPEMCAQAIRAREKE